MFKRILVPVDGSRTSKVGLDLAIRMGKTRGAKICLVHVVDESVVTQGIDAAGMATDDLFESLREGGRKIMSEAQARVRAARLKPTSVLIENIARRVADLILAQARKFRADVIVMGTHGRRGIARVVMGSAAEGVVRSSPVPVLLVTSKGGKG
jgi:nucleotide-binding universal stress UspA family protein